MTSSRTIPIGGRGGEGQCFINTTTVILEGRTDCTVCHGIVTGTGGNVVGVRYSHAWIEFVTVLPGHEDIPFIMCEDSCHDAGVLPRAYYYQVGQIDPESVIRYTPKQVKEMCIKHETYGPWHRSLFFEETTAGGTA